MCRSLVVAQRSAVAGEAVQPVVDPFGQAEEPLVGADHDPARVDRGAAGIGEQGHKHFGDAASMCRRADVPDRATG
jgi:hypothetical protein